MRQFELIAVEDLNVSGMVRNRSLARAISCTGWAEFRRQLVYKCERHGRELVVIEPVVPVEQDLRAPRGALLHRPLSGQRPEEVSLDLMADL